MAENNNVAAWLNAEINKLEQQLSAVTARLEAYREIRARMPATSGSNTENGVTPKRSRIDPNSIGSLATAILKETNGPLHVDELLTKIRSKGKSTLTKSTLSSTMYTYVKAGKLRQTAANTFALP
jgi:hypothetical protein